MNPETALLRRIDAYLNTAHRWRCDVVESGPFDLFLNKGGGNPYMSYARPARPLNGDLAAVIRAVSRLFEERGYVPRWEYIADLTPELTTVLETAGFPAPEMRPLMVLRGELNAPVSTAVEIRRVEDSAGLAEVSGVIRRGFGGPAEEDETTDPAGFAAGGMRYFGAYVAGSAVAGGVQIPLEGVAELAGIATLPEFRRQGIGAALTAAMAADARSLGCDVIFLSAGDEEIARVYQRAGFQTIGHAADTMKESG